MRSQELKAGKVFTQRAGERTIGCNDSVIDYDYTKCGYGKIIWPDGSQFEGYWINGQACGLGVYRAPPDR